MVIYILAKDPLSQSHHRLTHAGVVTVQCSSTNGACFQTYQLGLSSLVLAFYPRRAKSSLPSLFPSVYLHVV